MLHIAPEAFLAERLRRHPNVDYVSGDLSHPRVMVKLNMVNIPCPDGCFDVIYASHVLEHVPDDRRAMSELARVLKPDGWAVLQVPVDVERDTTYEDFSVLDPAERERVFGHHGHVRIYGRGYKSRLEGVGFFVKVDDFVKGISQSEIYKLGLIEAEDIYFCRK